MKFVVPILACALLSACTDDGVRLYIDVRTDLVPGDEFQRVRTEVRAGEGAPALSFTYEVEPGDPFLDGRRVAELDDLAPGTVQVLVELSKANGNIVATRPVVVTLAGDTAVTVVITRDCVGIECPTAADPTTAIACLGGRCVEPSCTEATPELCGPTDCTTPSECGAAPACVDVRCELGACLSSPIEARCAPTERCDLVLGCLPDEDTDSDAGGPLPSDAGTRDGGAPPLDAGPPPPDAGPPPMDAGVPTPDGGPIPFDAGTGGALDCADTFLGSALGAPVATGSTRSMDDDYGYCLGGASPDVSYGWIAPATGRYTFSTCGSDFDTVLTALSGSCTGSQLRCNDDRCSWESSFTLDLTAGQPLIIIVDGLAESGDYVLNIEPG